MHVLADGSELTMNDLANRLQVAPPTVTGLVRNLVEQGYVTRTNDESDWRIVRVGITESGREALSQHRQGVLDRMSGWLSELEPAEIQDLNSAIPALRHLGRILEAQQSQTGETRARNS
jgi:DNA-binding MarR family transcriptional regulator